MPDMFYRCSICKKEEFPVDNPSLQHKVYEEAKVHEAIPVEEGDIDGLVIKHEFTKDFFVYRIFIKTDDIASKHEKVYEEKNLLGKGVQNLRLANSLNHTFSYMKEMIDNMKSSCIEITPEELKELNSAFLEGVETPYNAYGLKSFKTLQTEHS